MSGRQLTGTGATPPPADDLLTQLLREFEALLAPLLAVADDPLASFDLLSQMGWNLKGLLGADPAPVVAAVTAVQAAIESVRTGQGVDSLPAARKALTALAAALREVDTLRQVLAAGSAPALDPAVAAALGTDLLDYLVLTRLNRRSPALVQSLILLTLVEEEQPTPLYAGGGTTGVPVRLPRPRLRLRLRNLAPLLSDPLGHLKTAYLPAAGVATDEQARAVTRLLFGRLRTLVLTLGGTAMAGMEWATEEEAAANLALQKAFTVGFPLRAPGAPATSALLGATLDIIRAGGPSATGLLGPGLDVTPFGLATLQAAIGAWDLALNAGGATGAFFVGRDRFALASGAGRVAVAGDLTRGTAGSTPALLVGSARGTRLEIGRLLLRAEAALESSAQDFGLLAEATSGAIVVAPGDGDGFLQRVLPAEGVRAAFDLALGWSSRKGLFFRGSAGLEATLNIGQDLFGVLRVDTAYLSLRAEAEAVRAIVAATVSVQLGPIKAAVERFGLDATLTFPAGGANLGVANLALAFKPPSGAALTVDAGVVVGGGYLFFDPQRQQYAGAVQLEIAGALNLTAFGLITTRMPDGSPGFSLLVLIAVRFTPPIQLGYGFTLNGVGGLLGINRTVDLESLRGGLRAGTLGSVLFPEDPIRNAPQIVSDLQAIFPPAPGRFLFGPMAILGWGTPTIITLELGLILELPAPVRLFILGRLRVLLPHERAPVIRLQLDALGVIDFERGDVALDATLFDSQVAQYTVTGQMALRANFGSDPNFVLAVGGFNPRFQAPAGFPPLERVAISLATGDNPRLRLEAYFALTTNTIQFGAWLEVYAKAGPFSIEGALGFDVLIQFDPFGFVADLGASIALKYNGRSVLSVGVEATLSGPRPWHAVGRAYYKFLIFSGTIKFDVRVGQRQPPPLPPPVQLRPLLLAALRVAENWTTQVARDEHPLVSLRDLPATAETLVHPLADLRVSQRVLPLDREIMRFGSTTPADERRFTLGVVDPDGTVRTTPEQGVETLADFFAPAQFLEMSDDDKLAAPAFERMPAGVRFATREYACGPAVVETEIAYERRTILAPPPAATVSRAAPSIPVPIGGRGPVVDPAPAEAVESAMTIIRKLGGQAAPRPFVTPARLVEQAAAVGAAGQAPFEQTGAARYGRPARGVSLRPLAFVAALGRGADAVPLDPASASGGGRPGGPQNGTAGQSYTVAMETLRRRLAANPQERAVLKVVPVAAEGPDALA